MSDFLVKSPHIPSLCRGIAHIVRSVHDSQLRTSVSCRAGLQGRVTRHKRIQRKLPTCPNIYQVIVLGRQQNCAIYIAMLPYRPISVILSDIVTIWLESTQSGDRISPPCLNFLDSSLTHFLVYAGARVTDMASWHAMAL